MRKYTHGGDIYSEDGFITGEKVYDFSSNLNPLGIPESVVEAIKNAADEFGAYPDPRCRVLTEAILSWENESFRDEYPEILCLNKNNIVCGNGAADLIFRIAVALKPEKALVFAPTFSEYAKALKSIGCNVVNIHLREDDDFQVTEKVVEEINKHNNTDIMFICNPNNPTGKTIPTNRMREIVTWAEEKNVIVVVDECFMEMTENSLKDSVIPYMCRGNRKIIVLKAFTKNFAMAGLRLGYIIGTDDNFLERVYTAGQPWSVSTPAQIAGTAATGEREYINRAVKIISEQRCVLMSSLKKKGFKVYESAADYILFRSDDSERFMSFMRKRNILIRSCADYEGLDSRYMRIAVKSPEDNRYFIEKMEEYFRG